MSTPALFVDRDGTLMEEVDYCSDPAFVRLFPGVGAALQRWSAAGYALVIITNQSGLGRGYFTLEAYHAVHAELLRQLAQAGAPPIRATYFCPDAAPSPRRKPEPGMLLEAAREHDLDLSRSWMIGDKAVDVLCGQRAGTRTGQVLTGYGAGEAREVRPDITGADFVEVTRLALGA